jgi:sensor histidine kinase YesM
MKSFLKFISFTILSLFIFAAFAYLLTGNFDDFEEKIIVFTTFLLSATSFSYYYFYSKWFANKKPFFKIFFSILGFSVLFWIGAIGIQIRYFPEFNYTVIALQNGIGVFIFLFEILVLQFLKNQSVRFPLVFSDSVKYYIQLIVYLSLFQLFLILLMFVDLVIQLGFHFNQLIETKNILITIIGTNTASFICLFLTNKWEVSKNNPVAKVVLSIIFGLFIYFYFGKRVVLIKPIFLIIVFVFLTFSNLFFYLFVDYRDKKRKSKFKLNDLTKNLSKKEAEYIQLKNKINPHFLFNNLNTLITFIELHPDKAIAFGHNLANVYRHYLKNQSEDFVLLQTEIDFITEYLQIYKAKFESGFTFEIEVETDNFYLLSFCLQEIADNIFKHNILEEDNPIHIKFFIEGEYLIVQNSINLKLSENSENSGLENIQKRYKLLIQKSIETKLESNSFTVKVPILKLE